jgi:hypothetical protein
VKVWSYLRGSTFEEVTAAGGKRGQSEVFTVLTGGDTAGGSQPPGFPAELLDLKSFSLVGVDPIVPEPSVSWLLIAAGTFGATGWLRRRR